MDVYVTIADPDEKGLCLLKDDLMKINPGFNITCTSSAEETTRMLASNECDVLITTASLLESFSIYAPSLKKTLQSIILIDEPKNVECCTSRNLADLIIEKPVDPIMLHNNILNLLNNIEELLYEHISSTLLQCGISPHINGSGYLRAAIKFVATTPMEQELKITKDVYPTVAQEFSTSSAKVERGIRHAIESAWEHGCFSNLRDVLGNMYYHFNYKPTNWEFIRLLSDKVAFDLGRRRIMKRRPKKTEDDDKAKTPDKKEPEEIKS